MKRFAVAVVALALFASHASAFVRSRTDKGTPIFWPGSCTWVQPDSGGSMDLPLTTVIQVINKAVNNWQSVTLGGCSYLQIIVDPAVPSEALLDHINVVKFRGDKWCRPAEGSTAEMCYSAEATAITTIFYDSSIGSSSDGNIVDADIELNEINFTFVWLPSNALPRGGTMKSDIENTLTHELGHLQGLDHTCWDTAAYPTAPIDDQGQPIPDCALVQAHDVSDAEYAKVVQATMYNYASPTEIIKRMPKTDDINGICAIYPEAKDPKSCVRPSAPSSSGCSLERGESHATLVVGLLLVLAAIALVRRRS